MDEVIIVDYDPRWQAMFQQEADRIRQIAPADMLVAVEHFGSTAVPGLAAKPIIDLLIVVRSLNFAQTEVVAGLEAMGYSFWRDNPVATHLFLVKGLPPHGPRTHHVHIVEADAPDPRHDGARFQDRLLFRDYLRTHSDEAQRYENLKRALAGRFGSDREAYTDAKSDFIASALRKAQEELPSGSTRIGGEGARENAKTN